MRALRTRRIEVNDEAELNRVFHQFATGTRKGYIRSLELMRWVWHRSPGGETDSWIIEAEERDGWRIVGHHALCPARFTRGEENWLCAKTINTFMFPEYRDRLLYLRFEQDCLHEVESRFDATYSMGPGTARLRKGLGYDNLGTLLWLERGLHPLHLISRIAANLVGRCSYAARREFSQALAAIAQTPGRRSSLELVEYTSVEAATSKFFADFWTQARGVAGLAVRRDIADLNWRFWTRPEFVGTTFTCTWSGGAQAYFIVNTSDPLMFSLVDFFMSPPRPELLDRALDELFVWCTHRGAMAIRFWTMSQGLSAGLLEVFIRKMTMFQLQRFVATSDLPRRLSQTGKNRASELGPWHVTEFLRLDVP